jgi:hypothetical protein
MKFHALIASVLVPNCKEPRPPGITWLHELLPHE